MLTQPDPTPKSSAAATLSLYRAFSRGIPFTQKPVSWGRAARSSEVKTSYLRFDRKSFTKNKPCTVKSFLFVFHTFKYCFDTLFTLYTPNPVRKKKISNLTGKPPIYVKGPSTTPPRPEVHDPSTHTFCLDPFTFTSILRGINESGDQPMHLNEHLIDYWMEGYGDGLRGQPRQSGNPSYLDGYDTGRRWFVSEDAREEEDA
jgi:hypothetical protein